MSAKGDTPPLDNSLAARSARWQETVSGLIAANTEQLAHRIMAEHFRRNPSLTQRYGERERGLYIRDTIYNLEALSAAIKLQTPELFRDYVAWLKSMLQARGIPTAGLPLHFECMKEILGEVVPAEMWPKTGEYLDVGMQETG